MTHRLVETTTPSSKWVNHNGRKRDTLPKPNFQLPETHRFQPFQCATIPLYNKPDSFEKKSHQSGQLSTRSRHRLFYPKSTISIRDRYQQADRPHRTDYARPHTRPPPQTTSTIRPLPEHTDPENTTIPTHTSETKHKSPDESNAKHHTNVPLAATRNDTWHNTTRPTHTKSHLTHNHTPQHHKVDAHVAQPATPERTHTPGSRFNYRRPRCFYKHASHKHTSDPKNRKIAPFYTKPTNTIKQTPRHF